MAKTKNNREGGIGGSLKNSLSKLTERVTLKAPQTKDLPKATASKPVQPATPKPMSPPQQTPKAAEPVQSRSNNGSNNGSQNANFNGNRPQQNTSSSVPQAGAKPQPTPQAQPKPQNTAPVQQSVSRSAPAVSSTPPAAINSSSNMLGNDVAIDGRLKFSDNLIFDGRLKGEIVSDGALAVHPNAVIEATVSVRTLVIAGKIVGDITATESVHLTASAVVIGDITTGSLTMEPKASFQGRGKIGNPTEAPANSIPISGQSSNQTSAPSKNTVKVSPAPAPVAA